MRGESPQVIEAEPGRRGLWISLLVYRWTVLGLMTVLSIFVNVTRLVPAIGILVVLAAWNGFLSVQRPWTRPYVRWIDLGLSVGLLLTAPLLVEPGSLARFPFLAAAYPLATVLTWSAATGVRGGLFAAATLSIPLVLSRPLNQLSYRNLTAGEIISVATGCVYYALGALIVGLFAETIDRAGRDLRGANERALHEHERAARLEERESLARALHDSILQTLALVQRRGREMAAHDRVAGSEVAELVAVVHREEEELRGLLRRGVEEAPEGCVPLRTVLEAAAYRVTRIPVTISTIEPVWLPAGDTAEVSAAVQQGLENAAEHAHASRITLFGEDDGREIVISVLDDGVGFDLDESRLEADGRLGITRSMKGRIEGLGGRMRITTSPGHGTKVEFRLPTAR